MGKLGVLHSPGRASSVPRVSGGVGVTTRRATWGLLVSILTPQKTPQDEELLGHVQSAILQVQGDCEKLNITTGNLIEDHRQKQKDIKVTVGGARRSGWGSQDKQGSGLVELEGVGPPGGRGSQEAQWALGGVASGARLSGEDG